MANRTAGESPSARRAVGYAGAWRQTAPTPLVVAAARPRGRRRTPRGTPARRPRLRPRRRERARGRPARAARGPAGARAARSPVMRPERTPSEVAAPQARDTTGSGRTPLPGARGAVTPRPPAGAPAGSRAPRPGGRRSPGSAPSRSAIVRASRRTRSWPRPVRPPASAAQRRLRSGPPPRGTWRRAGRPSISPLQSAPLPASRARWRSRAAITRARTHRRALPARPALVRQLGQRAAPRPGRRGRSGPAAGR